ncbi:hypothetical protein H4R34_000995 [Dimargaris verticillata]|uniref:Monopolin complex subunit Csm1/Pcs1 C-terminal domain-containing protein n=1 Tax=Dimargaris verticillata TaxID=2761393 RepID=A0A9W8B587_9FUNG|nr:hypothetical protein H4R34_000995 [Dimargaris verticillata]
MPRPKRKQPPQWDDVFLEAETPKPRKTKRIATAKSRQAVKSAEPAAPKTPEPRKARGNLVDEVDELAAPPTVKKPPARKASTTRPKASTVPAAKSDSVSTAPRRRGRQPKKAPPKPAAASPPPADSVLASNNEAAGKASTEFSSDERSPSARPTAVTRGRGRGRSQSRGTSRSTQSTRAVKVRTTKSRSKTPAEDSESMFAEVSVTIDPLLRRSSPIPSPPLSPLPAHSPLASATLATSVSDTSTSITTVQRSPKATRLKAVATPARRTRASLAALTKNVETPVTVKRTRFARMPTSGIPLHSADEGVAVEASASDDEQPKELADSPQTPTRLKARPTTKVPHCNGHGNSSQSSPQTASSLEALHQAHQRIAELEKKYDNLRTLRVTEAERVLTMYKQSAEERFNHAETLLIQLQDERDVLAHQVTTLQADLATQAASQASASQEATEALVAKVQQLEAELCCTKSRMEDLETHRRLSQTHADYTLREKLKLYETLTGLSIEDVTTAEEGVQFQCAQTGKAGLLKYTLTIFDDDPESIQYDAVPAELSDAKAGQLATALPDYLLDTICFQQDVAPMFFTRTVNVLQNSSGSPGPSNSSSDALKPCTDE